MTRTTACAGAAVVSVWTSAALGQPACQPTWSDRFSHGGVGFHVQVLTTFDPDGLGTAPEVLIAGGSFSTAGGLPAHAIAQWDGAAWSELGTGLSPAGAVGPYVYALATHTEPGLLPTGVYAGGIFSRAGNVIAANIARWDGVSWHSVGGGTGDQVRSFATHDPDGPGPGGAVLVVGGPFNSVGPPTGTVPASRIAIWNGSDWSALGGGVNSSAEALASFDEDGAGPAPPRLFAGGSFITAGGVPVNRIARWDGTQWSPVGAGVGSHVFTMRVIDLDGPGPDPSALFVGGNFTTAGGLPAKRIARWNGTAWSGLGGGISFGGVQSIRAVDEDGPGPQPATLFVAGNQVPFAVQRWSGSTWSPTFVGNLDGTVQALECFGEHGSVPTLHVGGSISRVVEVELQNIARLVDGELRPLDSGPNSAIAAIAEFDHDGPGPGRPAMVAGGAFDYVGGVRVNRIGSYDGASWSSLGSGVGGPPWSPYVAALSVFDEDGPGPQRECLFASGFFSTAGGVPTQGVARWDGATWSPVGSIVHTSAYCSITFDPDEAGPAPEQLYVGGQTMPLIRWNGAAWTEIGAGGVMAMTLHDADGPGPGHPTLIAGGNFTTAGGVSAFGVARWDGVAWTAVGSGLSNTAVTSLASFDEDGAGPALPNLYVGGQFAGYLRRLAGTTWAAVPGAPDAWVTGLAAIDPDGPGPQSTALLVGGRFSTAGGISTGGIAAWHGAGWSGFSGGVTSSSDPWVFDFAVFDDDGPGPVPAALYVGGDFAAAGGVSSSSLARWGCAPSCYANCTGDSTASGDPVLTVADFGCFQTMYVTGDPYADCNTDGMHTLADFGCFQSKFVAGCP